MSGSAYTARWEQIVASVLPLRRPATYAANWNEYAAFPGDLDDIGRDADHPLSLRRVYGNEPAGRLDVARLRDALASASRAFGKQVLFTDRCPSPAIPITGHAGNRRTQTS